MIDIALTLAYIGTIAISGFLGYLVGKAVKKPNNKPAEIGKTLEFDNVVLRANKSEFIADTIFVDCYYKGDDEYKKFTSPSVWISPKNVLTSDGHISC